MRCDDPRCEVCDSLRLCDRQGHDFCDSRRLFEQPCLELCNRLRLCVRTLSFWDTLKLYDDSTLLCTSVSGSATT